MISADFINGAFEIAAGLAILDHCRVMLRDKAVKGVSVWSVVFFTLWGFWNLYYYPHLGQFWSFVGGVGVVGANGVWAVMIVWYGYVRPRRLAASARRPLDREARATT
jgi:hypothetical protein